MIKMSNNNKSTDEKPISEEDEIFKLLTHETRRNIIKALGERSFFYANQKQFRY